MSAVRSEPSLAIVPLVAEDQTLGVVEVAAPEDRLNDRRDAVLALVRQSAALMKISQERAASDRTSEGLERLLGLARKLAVAPTAVAAMRAVAQACSEHLDAPIVIVRPDRSGRGWYLAGIAGMGARSRARLRAVLHALPRTISDDAQIHGVVEAFEGITRRPARSRAAGNAFVVAEPRHLRSQFLRGAISELEVALRLLAGRNGTEVDVGMAWTAHELRRPLVGARAALDVLLTTPAGNGDRDLLRRTKAELDSLADIVDPLLACSINGRTKKADADLVAIVNRAVESSCDDGERDRIVMRAPKRMPIRADVAQLRSAVANLIRNALMYSPSTTPVEVVVDADRVRARVTVRDRGPGIPSEERSRIFDPFVRGAVGRDVARGNGLGLFVVRRVAEAHGGSVRLDRTSGGARFCLQLPIPREDLRASAS